MIAYDISQFVRHPAASGIQRVLMQLSVRASDESAFCVHDGPKVLVLRRSLAHELLSRGFGPGHDESVLDEARRRAHERLRSSQVLDRFRAYVLAEVTYDWELLQYWERLRAAAPARVFGLFYDGLPEQQRHLIGASPPARHGEYFRLMGRLVNVACISHEAASQLAALSRRPEADFHVAVLGADAFPRRDAGVVGSHFTIVGDLKARKRVDLAVHALRRCRERGEDVSLHVVGRSVPGEDATLALVRSEARSRESGVKWLSGADDEAVLEELNSSIACLFLSAQEGFGLPVLEALHGGVPVIVDSSTPSLRYVAEGGQIRLEAPTVESVAEAMCELADPTENRRLRLEARDLALPTWEEFVQGLEHWILGSLPR